MNTQKKQPKFKRPYLVIEKIFERVALACDKRTSTACKTQGAHYLQS